MLKSVQGAPPPVLSGAVLSDFAKEPSGRGPTASEATAVTVLCSDALQWVPWESVLEQACAVRETVRCVTLAALLEGFKQSSGDAGVGMLVLTGRHFGHPAQLKTLEAVDSARLQWHMRRVSAAARMTAPFAAVEYPASVLVELHSQHAPYQNVIIGARDTLVSLRAKFPSVVFGDVGSVEVNPSSAGDWLDSVVSKDAASGDVQFAVIVVLSARELLGFSDATAVWAARAGVTLVFVPHSAMKAVIRVVGDEFAHAAKAYARLVQGRSRGGGGKDAGLPTEAASPWLVLRGAAARCRGELGVRVVIVNSPAGK
jgi:hypothetical protein